jgi:uncharacterized protein (TIGR02246 family)
MLTHVRNLALLLLAAGCCSSHSSADFSAGDAANAIAKRNARFIANARSGDAAALVRDFYAPDAVVMAPGAPPLRGTDAIAAFWTQFLGSAAVDATLTADNVIEADSGDLATEVGSYTMKVTPRNGGAGEQDEGKYVVVWRKRGGEWRAAVDSFSSNSAPKH